MVAEIKSGVSSTEINTGRFDDQFQSVLDSQPRNRRCAAGATDLKDYPVGGSAINTRPHSCPV